MPVLGSALNQRWDFGQSRASGYFSVKWRTDQVLAKVSSSLDIEGASLVLRAAEAQPVTPHYSVPGQATAWAPRSDCSSMRIYLKGLGPWHLL